MTDFRNDGERLVYSSNVCGLIASLYDKNNRIDWKWQSMDGVITKGSLGEKCTDSNPTDRAKSGTKHSILVDGNGMPLSVVVNDAAKRDMT